MDLESVKNPKSIPVRNRHADPGEEQPLIDGAGRALRFGEPPEKNFGFGMNLKGILSASLRLGSNLDL